MSKTNKPKRKTAVPAAPEATAPEAMGFDAQIVASNLSLHELFQKQAAAMLERVDVSEEQKQAVLVGMNCPCCGAGGFSFTAKLKREG